jgi:hypothetical protein
VDISQCRGGLWFIVARDHHGALVARSNGVFVP